MSEPSPEDLMPQETRQHKQTKKEKSIAKIERIFQSCEFVQVAFKLAYLGANYNGLEKQINSKDTIEEHLFNAILNLRLVQSIENSNYSRGGRTDKGVSAFGNVVTFRLRQLPAYCNMINRLMPKDIKLRQEIIVRDDFNARYRCVFRTYKYYFLLENMNINSMAVAISKFVGIHDFRNFCKVNLTSNDNFERNIFFTSLDQVSKESDSIKIYNFTIQGNGFLWHQIRCIVAILFMVGQGKEKPEIVDYMLDVEKCPGKPNYEMAPAENLVLYDCKYPNDILEWKNKEIKNQENLHMIRYIITNHLNQQYIQLQLYRTLLQKIDEDIDPKFEFNKDKPSKHMMIAEREMGPTIEESKLKLKGRKLEVYNEKLKKKEEFEMSQTNNNND